MRAYDKCYILRKAFFNTTINRWNDFIQHQLNSWVHTRLFQWHCECFHCFTCPGITCKAPATSLNQVVGKISRWFRRRLWQPARNWYVDDEAYFRCDEGYRFDLEGRTIINKAQCLETGSWSAEPTRCVESIQILLSIIMSPENCFYLFSVRYWMWTPKSWNWKWKTNLQIRATVKSKFHSYLWMQRRVHDVKKW